MQVELTIKRKATLTVTSPSLNAVVPITFQRWNVVFLYHQTQARPITVINI